MSGFKLITTGSCLWSPSYLGLSTPRPCSSSTISHASRRTPLQAYWDFVTCAASWRCLPALVTLVFFALRFVAVVSNRIFFLFQVCVGLLELKKV